MDKIINLLFLNLFSSSSDLSYEVIDIRWFLFFVITWTFNEFKNDKNCANLQIIPSQFRHRQSTVRTNEEDTNSTIHKYYKIQIASVSKSLVAMFSLLLLLCSRFCTRKSLTILLSLSSWWYYFLIFHYIDFVACNIIGPKNKKNINQKQKYRTKTI